MNLGLNFSFFLNLNVDFWQLRGKMSSSKNWSKENFFEEKIMEKKRERYLLKTRWGFLIELNTLNTNLILYLVVVGTNLRPRLAKMASKNYALPLNGER